MMHITSLRFWAALLLCLSFWACEDRGQGNGGDADSLLTDSIPYDTVALPPGQPIVPELVGRWQLVEMRNGEMPMSTDDIGESVMELTAAGQMITSAPDLPPETVAFSYRNDSLYNEDFGTVQRIEELSTQRLVLLMEVDNTPIRWIYQRLPAP